MNMPNTFSGGHVAPPDGQASCAYDNQLEPPGLLRHFIENPPAGFEPFMAHDTPGFFAPFDLLTTADPAVRQRLASLPGGGLLLRLLRFRVCFFGTTVSEYAPFPSGATTTLPDKMLSAWARRSRLMIVKDVPEQSPLLPTADSMRAEAFLAACQKHGFIVLDGQALAYVPIDFSSADDYLSRLSAGRRKNIRRKLRSREQLRIEILPTGHDRFDDEAFLDELYALYQEVYAQSEIHFDLLSAAYFKALFQDAALQGKLFLYYNGIDLIGYNLCFVHDHKLIDKYVGFRYPAARTFNLYFVSWMENLAYAREHGLTHYVAGWTDPEVKSFLGASFTFTRHAVFVRNPLLRFILRKLSHHFESDRMWFNGMQEEDAQ